jgi:hypothetical protein
MQKQLEVAGNFMSIEPVKEQVKPAKKIKQKVNKST